MLGTTILLAGWTDFTARPTTVVPINTHVGNLSTTPFVTWVCDQPIRKRRDTVLDTVSFVFGALEISERCYARWGPEHRLKQNLEPYQSQRPK